MYLHFLNTDTNQTTSSMSAVEPLDEFGLVKRNLFFTTKQERGVFRQLCRVPQTIYSLLFNFMPTPTPKDEISFQVRADPALDDCADN